MWSDMILKNLLKSRLKLKEKTVKQNLKNLYS